MKLLDILKVGVEQSNPLLFNNFPIRCLSISKKAANQVKFDLSQKQYSRTIGRVDLWYNILNGQFIITDGYHRVIQRILEKKKNIAVNIWASTYSDYSNVQPNDLLFEPKECKVEI